MRILIAGAGIGGLTAAIALRNAGHEVAVYERAAELREAGAGITLWTNAVLVLRALGVNKAIEAQSTPIARSELRSWRGALLLATDFTTLFERLGAPSIGIHRADLQNALADHLGRDTIHLGREVSGFAQGPDRVTARFLDGSEECADALIGADGIRSAVRGQLLGHTEPRYAGYTAWRGVARIDRPEVPSGMTMLAMGRGAQVGYLPIGAGRTYWFATSNVPQGQHDPPGQSRELLLRRFRDWYAPVPAVIASTPEEAILRNDIVDRPPVTTWGEGRVTLLGDAAHPTTPNLGQGACQAIEDALVLARSLEQNRDVPEALREYERRRYTRTAQITAQSWQLGKLFALENPLACWLRDRAFALSGNASINQTRKMIEGGANFSLQRTSVRR